MFRKMFIAALVALGGMGLASMSSTPASAQYPVSAPCTVTLLSSATDSALGQTLSTGAVVQDAAGAPIAGEECVFLIESQPGEDASVAPRESSSNEDGVATANLFVGSTPGILVVRAECCDASSQISLAVMGTAVLPEVQEPAAPAAAPPTGFGQHRATGDDNWLMWAAFPLALVTGLGAILLIRRRIPH